MALERSEVEKIAHLARLGLNEGDLPHTTATLNNILGLIDGAVRQYTDELIEEGVPAIVPSLETEQAQHDQPSDERQEDAEIDGLKHGGGWEGFKKARRVASEGERVSDRRLRQGG